MSNSNFNNGKRHVRDRACYGGMPNQKKRIRFINPDEEVKKERRYFVKYNIDVLITAFIIANWWGDGRMKALTIFLVLLNGFSIFDKEKYK